MDPGAFWILIIFVPPENIKLCVCLAVNLECSTLPQKNYLSYSIFQVATNSFMSLIMDCLWKKCIPCTLVHKKYMSSQE